MLRQPLRSCVHNLTFRFHKSDKHMHKYAGIVSVCNVISLALIIVGVSTSRWITSDVSGGGESNRGDISFGLFRISYSIRFKEADYREEEDNGKTRPMHTTQVVARDLLLSHRTRRLYVQTALDTISVIHCKLVILHKVLSLQTILA